MMKAGDLVRCIIVVLFWIYELFRSFVSSLELGSIN